MDVKKPLLKSSYNSDDADRLENHLAAEPIKVRKTKFQTPDVGQSASSLSENAYAYWIADEGVKTKINLLDPKKESDDENDIWDRLSVATEPNLSLGYNLNFIDKFDELRDGLLSVYSITEHEEDFRNENLGSDVSWSDLLAANYHSLTSSSYGVLSDVGQVA